MSTALRRSSPTAALAVIVAATTTAAAGGPVIVHVDDDAKPGGDGTTWLTAYRFLQDALAGLDPGARGDGTEIRVAQGTYLPDRDEQNPFGTGARDASFRLAAGVTLRGGYAGLGEEDPDARDVDLYVTMLSGDLNGDDGPEFTNNGENSYHVVAGGGVAAGLDGFTITAGNADGGADEDRRGAGWLTGDGEAWVTGCRFAGNSAAVSGGGIHHGAGRATLDGIVLDGNRAPAGAGLYTGGTVFGAGAGIAGPDAVVNVGRFEVGRPEPEGEIGRFVIDAPFDAADPTKAGGRAGGVATDLGGTLPGVEHDQVVFPGPVDLGGGLTVRLLEPFVPTPGERFLVVDAAAATGGFDVVRMPTLPAPLYLRLDGGDGLGVEVVADQLARLVDFGDPISFPIDGGTPTAATLGELDGEPGLDVAVAVIADRPGDPGLVLAFFNDGSGTGFERGLPLEVGPRPSAIAVGELVGGAGLGDDVAVADAEADNVTLLDNELINQQGRPARGSIPVGEAPSAIAVTDVDRDGRTDLLVANSRDDNVFVLINGGNGMFTLAQTIESGTLPLAVPPEDLDNDKDEDESIVNAGDGTIGVSFNDGGLFDMPRVLRVGAMPVAAATADVDGNGFADVLVANRGEDTISVVLNNGDGTFVPSVAVPVGAGPRSVATLDLEVDGDQDAAVIAESDEGNPVLKLLRNDRGEGDPPTFTVAREIVVGATPIIVLSGDLDADGITDLLTIDQGAPPLPDRGGARPAAMLGSSSFDVILNAPPCLRADIDRSGDVGFSDLLRILSAWGLYEPCPPYAPEDLDLDCAVGFSDLLVVLGQWGPCTPAFGACCFVEQCLEASRPECEALRGHFVGVGSTCETGCVDKGCGWVIEAPATWRGDTCIERDSCPGGGLDVRWQVTIPEDGEWTFSLCGGAQHDTVLLLGTTCCGDDVASDDDGCGTLQSEIVAPLTVGTYFLTLEGFSEVDCGPFTLRIFRTAP